MPPRIYAKHKSTSKESEYNTKRGVLSYANIKGTYTKLSQYDKHIHITCVFYHNKSKRKIYKMLTSRMKIP